MDKSQIINQIKLYLNIKTDSEFAQFLGISQPTVSSWRKRNTLDHEIIIAKCKELNVEWLITGEGEMLNASKVDEISGISKKDLAVLEQEYGFFPDMEVIKSYLTFSETQLKNILSSKKTSLKDKIATSNNISLIADTLLLNRDTYYKHRFITITEKEYMEKMMRDYNPSTTSFENVKLKWITLIYQFESDDDHLSYIIADKIRYLKTAVDSGIRLGFLNLDEEKANKLSER